MTSKRTFRVELLKGKVRWFYHIVASNGNILMTSQKYFSKSNARRAASKVASDLKSLVKETKK